MLPNAIQDGIDSLGIAFEFRSADHLFILGVEISTNAKLHLEMSGTEKQDLSGETMRAKQGRDEDVGVEDDGDY